MYFLLKNGYNVNGGLFMAAARRIELTLPEGLLETVDSIAEKENITRSECIESAMRFYIEEREKRDLRDQMIQGVSGNGRNQYHDFGGLFFCGTGALVYKGINFNVKRS